MLSKGERILLRSALQHGQRIDGRTATDFRSLEIEFSSTSTVIGFESVEVKLGSTYVVVSVKAELGTPSKQQPDQGFLKIGAEIAPCAIPQLHAQSVEEAEQSLMQLLETHYYAGAKGGPIDLRQLIVSDARACWTLYLDCLVLNFGGNVLDAASIGAALALSRFRLPYTGVSTSGTKADLGEIFMDDDPNRARELEIAEWPIIITVGLISDYLMLDCLDKEETCLDSRVSYGVSEDGLIHGVTQQGQQPIDIQYLSLMMEQAVGKGTQMWRDIKDFLARSQS